MSIILTILKVIGIILLIILLVVLAVLLLLLFVPFRYSAGGRKEGDALEFSGKVTWLLHAVTVQVGFEPGGAGLTKDLRIFGISLLKLKEKLSSGKKGTGSAKLPADGGAEKIAAEEINVQEAGEASPASDTSAEAGATEASADSGDVPAADGAEVLPREPERTEESIPDAEGTDPGGQTVEAPDAGPENNEEENEGADPGRETGEIEEASPASSKGGAGISGDSSASGPGRVRAVRRRVIDLIFSVLSKIAGKLNGIIGKLFQLVLKVFIRICLLPLTIVEKLDAVLRKIGKICRKIGAFSDFIFDERVQTFLAGIMGMLKKLIGHVLPRRLNGYVRFGLDDPGRTGRVLAAVAPFYPKYGKTFSLEPDFDDLCFEGKAELKGRIYLFYVAFIGLRAILNKNTKYVIRQLKKLKEVR